MKKLALLKKLTDNIEAAFIAGAFPEQIRARKPEPVQGPRAGVLRINAGMDNGTLYRLLVADKKAKLRQLFPREWIGLGEPSAYLSGRDLCLECPWPDALQTKKVMLSGIGERPQLPSTFIVGPNEFGHTITLQLDRSIKANLMIAGTTGGGKTVTVTQIVAQLARNERAARFIVMDGKDELQHLSTLRGLVGPYANTNATVLAALRYVLKEIETRDSRRDNAPLYVVWDEPQKLLLNHASAAVDFFNVVSQCRSKNIKVVMATQSPKQELFDVSMTRGQFGARICHKVADRWESEAAIGDTEPRADHLTAAGDAYVIAGALRERVLVAYPDESLIDSVLGYDPEIDEWPVEYSDLDSKSCWNPDQAAAALYAAQNGFNREQMRDLGVSFTNSEYGTLKAFGREMLRTYDGFPRPSVVKDV